MLDLPHLIVKSLAKCNHNFHQRDKLKPKPFVDRYAFDLGYHSAYTLATFMIMLQFAILVPYVAMFAGIFFAFKYNVDKYNLTFVYNSEFRGRGEIYKRVMPLSVLNIVIFQVILIGYFAIRQKKTNWTLFTGIGLVFIEVVAVAITFKRIDSKKKQSHFKHRALERPML